MTVTGSDGTFRRWIRSSRRGPRTISLVLSSVLAASVLVACTPRGDAGQDVLEQFLGALAENDAEAAAEYTDNPSKAEPDLQDALEGLDPNGLESQVIGSDGGGEDRSRIDVEMDWFLPGEREWSYETQVTMLRLDSGWKVRWAPSALHPRLGSNQFPSVSVVPSSRTSVVGSDGGALLVPGEVYRVVVDRDSVDSVSHTVRQVADAVNDGFREVAGEEEPRIDGQRAADAASGGAGSYSVIVLEQSTPPVILDELRSIPGVSVNDEAAMVRTDPSLAPDLMSRIEQVTGDASGGVDGWQVNAVTADGATVSTLYREDPKTEPAIRASVDTRIQRAAQNAVNTRPEEEAMIVAIRPSTGEILAVAQTAEADRRGDLALSGQFPPGSTFKVVTSAAGIDRQGLNPDSIVPCPGTMEIGDRRVTNYNGSGAGDIPLRDAFARSCNTTFGDISYHLDPGELQDEAARFGIGTDYDISGLLTVTGSVDANEDSSERTDAGYGQGMDLASPFGMALVAATVANGSTPTPTLVPQAGTYASRSAEPIPEPTLGYLRDMMRAVVTNGTAGVLNSRGEVHGKTGEAETGGGSHSWFIGYRDDIAFATLIVEGGGSEHAVNMTDRFLSEVDGD